MSVKKLKENYGEIEQYLDLFDNNRSYVLKSSNNTTASITISLINQIITLNQKNLEKLERGEHVENIRDFKYIATYGILYKEYAEIYLDIMHPNYEILTFHYEDETWPIPPLEFEIGNTTFIVGLASPLLVLLTEPIYRDSDFSYNFHNITSMKIIIKDKNLDIQNEILKGLYYLNSFYLKPMQLCTKLKSIEFLVSDPLDLYSNKTVEDILQPIKRTKIQKDLNSTEPLQLYNHALSCKNEEKFLFLYRVLEFFMHKARVENLKKIRIDMNITEDELIKIVEQRNEENQLSTLLIEAIPLNLKNKIIKYAQTHNLIKDNKYNSLVQALYKFRNSIVHAKEKEITRTTIPDPFNTNSVIDHWIVIVDEFAIKCIEKYN